MGAHVPAAHLLRVTADVPGKQGRQGSWMKIVKNVPGWSCHVPVQP